MVISENHKAILYTLLGILLFSITTALAKWLTMSNNVFLVTFFRNSLGFLFILAVVFYKQRIFLPKPKTSISNHMLRGFLGFIATLALFLSFAKLPLQDATVLTYLGPLILTILSVLVLREKLDWKNWLSLTIGFIGILLILKPSGMVSTTGLTFGIFAALSNACALIVIKKISKQESALTITFYYLLISTLFSTIFLPFVWETPSQLHIGGMVLLGISSSLAHYCLATGLRHAPASTVAPFNYTSIIWASLFGILFWNEDIRVSLLLGGFLIIGSGVFMALSKKKSSLPT